MTINEFNPYDILGVDKETSAEDIKKAFKSKSKILHPDTGGSPETFNNLKKAFDILTDPAKKILYDDYGMDDLFNVEKEAKLTAIQIVVSALDGLPESCEAGEEITSIFENCLRELKLQEEQARKAKDKLQLRLNNIQIKPADDFLSNEIIRVIRGYEKAIKNAQLNHYIHEVAFGLVKEYKFDVTKISFLNDLASFRHRAETNNVCNKPTKGVLSSEI